MFWGTTLNQFIPWWSYAWESVRIGVFPLWDTMLGMGAPLAANYQTALFYPPTWLYFICELIGGVGAMAWFVAVMVVLHLSWAALGMALLIKELGLSRFAQVLGGLAFGLSGYLVARAGFLSINSAVAWLPWIILGGTRLVKAYRLESFHCSPLEAKNITRKQKLYSALLLLVTSLTLQLLAGHAQTAWYSLLLLILWVVYLGIINPWFEAREAKKKPVEPEPADETVADPNINWRFKSWFWLVALFCGALFLAAALAAIQLIPTAEYLLESQRSTAVDYDFAMSYSFWPWRFLSFIAPGLFGNPALGDYWGFANYWEDAVYIGLIPFVLAMAALVSRGKKIQKGTMVSPGLITFLGMLILVVFLLALGRNTPIFPWLYRYIPTFDMFQAPTRISILAIFALVLLAAVGADSWSKPRGKQLYWLRLGVMAAAAIAVGAALALLLSRIMAFEIRLSFIRATAWLGLWGVCLGWLAIKAPDARESPAVEKHWGWWQWAVVSVVGLNLVVAGWGLNPSVPLDVYTESAPTAEGVEQNLAGGRIYLGKEDEEMLKFERFLRFDTFLPFEDGEDWGSLRASLLPNITLLDSLSSANNFDPLLPGRYSTWIDRLENADSAQKDQMLNLMGVTVVESIDLEEEYGVRFDTRSSFPRIRWASCGIQTGDGEAALELLLSGFPDNGSTIVLESGDNFGTAICNDQQDAELRVLEEYPSQTSVKVLAETAGYLVVADTWYPGWRAYVDGVQSKLWRANYMFRAVAVPAGEHEVKIDYQPSSFLVGGITSGAALVLLLLLAVLRFRANRTV